MISTVPSFGWRLARSASLGVFALVFALPLAAALAWALWQAADASAWARLWSDPQFAPAWRRSVAVAVGSTVLSLAGAMAITAHLHGSSAWQRLDARLAPMLAVPHAAFAIGVALLVMPSGLLARLLAPAFGWDAPPPWHSVHDEHGVALTLVLALKELPFLLWNIVALLARPELSAQLQQHRIQGRSFGWTPRSLWWRVWWPMLLPRLAWPLLAVLAYSLSVVDVALVTGPLSPPPLAVLAWQSLLDGDVQTQALGAVQVGCLSLTLALLALVGVVLGGLWRRAAVAAAAQGAPGARARDTPPAAAAVVFAAVRCLYAAALVLLALAACAGPWTFPHLLPQSWDVWAGWRSAAPATLAFSAALSAAASALAVVLAIAWFEATPARADAVMAPVLLAPLAVPPLLWLVGLYPGALWLRLDGTVTGLLWVHVIAVLPYALIVLAPAWRAYDPRYELTALSLGRSRWAFWWRAKWPMLRSPIAAALAVGFAVAVAQYLPTLFIGAGRHATVTTEAVTLAAGGQRQTAAVYALWQAVLPLLAFALAARVNRRKP